MNIKNLIEETVIHASFGKGVIKDADERHLVIFFPEYDRLSKFVYPSCFDAFLKLENMETEMDVKKDVEQWRIESGAAQKEKCRLQYVKTQQAIKARQTALEERKRRAGQRVMEFRSGYNKVNNPAAGNGASNL